MNNWYLGIRDKELRVCNVQIIYEATVMNGITQNKCTDSVKEKGVKDKTVGNNHNLQMNDQGASERRTIHRRPKRRMLK